MSQHCLCHALPYHSVLSGLAEVVFPMASGSPMEAVKRWKGSYSPRYHRSYRSAFESHSRTNRECSCRACPWADDVC